MWNKKIDLLNRNQVPFLNWVWMALMQMIFSVGFTRRFIENYENYSKEKDPYLEQRRAFLLGLGSSWIFSLVWQILIVLIVFITSWFGWWSWVWSSSNQLVPPMWILKLGDTSFYTLFILSCFSVVLSFSVGVSGIGLLFVSSALFAGVISTQGALLILFGERLGLWIFTLVKTKSEVIIRRDLVLRVILSIVFFIIQFLIGGFVIQMSRYNLGFEYRSLFSRFLEFGYLYFWWTALESLVVLIVFHYYWLLLTRFRKETL